MQYYSMLEYLMMKRSRRSINLILQDFYHSMVGSTEIVGRNTLNYPPTAALTHWLRICRSLHLRCGILALVDSLLPENNAWQSPPEESPVVFLCITTGITCWPTPPKECHRRRELRCCRRSLQSVTSMDSKPNVILAWIRSRSRWWEDISAASAGASIFVWSFIPGNVCGNIVHSCVQLMRSSTCDWLWGMFSASNKCTSRLVRPLLEASNYRRAFFPTESSPIAETHHEP